jgi:precorrin-2/cobalt-factor-2 C20-methyltransferase
VLNDLGLASRAVIVEAATREDQKITRLSEAPPGFRPYFSTILVYKGAEPW